VDEGFSPGIKTFSSSAAMEKCAIRFEKTEEILNDLVTKKLEIRGKPGKIL